MAKIAGRLYKADDRFLYFAYGRTLTVLTGQGAADLEELQEEEELIESWKPRFRR